MHRFFRFVLVSMAGLMAAWSVAAAQLAAGQLERRLDNVCALLQDRPGGYDSVFAASFLAQVPAAQLTMGLQQMTGICGHCTSWVITKRTSPFAASASIRTANGYVIPVNISLEETSPYKISGLLLRNPVKENSSIDSVLAELRALPGTTSLYVEKLGTGKPLYAVNAEAALPIGSTFKLYILGELARAVAAGSVQWSTVTTLKRDRASYPSGKLHEWPDGSPITLHSLAALMISQSDNTATDALLDKLGRTNVERMQGAMGHSAPSKNMPFLSTRELFTLKFSDHGGRARRYYAASEAQRREMLAREIPMVSRDSVVFEPVPICADSVEWFASTHDLVKAMDWLRNAMNSESGKPLHGILTINKGLEIDEDQWTYVGYKGGSETGVVNMTYLMKDVKGEWYAMSVSWCDPHKAVDEMKFFGLVGSLLRMIRH